MAHVVFNIVGKFENRVFQSIFFCLFLLQSLFFLIAVFGYVPASLYFVNIEQSSNLQALSINLVLQAIRAFLPLFGFLKYRYSLRYERSKVPRPYYKWHVVLFLLVCLSCADIISTGLQLNQLNNGTTGTKFLIDNILEYNNSFSSTYNVLLFRFLIALFSMVFFCCYLCSWPSMKGSAGKCSYLSIIWYSIALFIILIGGGGGWPIGWLAFLLSSAIFILIVWLLLLLQWQAQSVGRYYKELNQVRNAAMHYSQGNWELQDCFAPNREELNVTQEIHDSVGHVLTACVMQLRNLRKLQNYMSDTNYIEIYTKSVHLIEELEEYVSKSIQDVRVVLHKLHLGSSSRYDWPNIWSLTCKMFSDITGVKILLYIPPSIKDPQEGPKLISVDMGEAVFRILREAVTNSVRHGYATVIEINFRVYLRKARLLVLISDNGVGTSRHLNFGMGLERMRQLVRSLNGEIAFQTLPAKGFDIGLSFPLAVNPIIKD